MPKRLDLVRRRLAPRVAAVRRRRDRRHRSSSGVVAAAVGDLPLAGRGWSLGVGRCSRRSSSSPSISLIIAPRRARSIGYRLRDDDLLFRRGIMFQRFVSVPYGRMQLIDINRGPVGRILGLADLKFVTAAASTGVVDPGPARGRGRRAARPAGRAGGEQPGRAVTGRSGRSRAPERAAERLTDGEWHRLHPATPLLRGGIVFIAVLGFVLSNLRERIVELLRRRARLRRRPGRRDLQPRLGGLGAARRRGRAPRSASARSTCRGGCTPSASPSDAVEVRSGILFRTQRKARLDRIQGINVVRPLLARIFGAAKLDITVAGHDANVQLAYLGSALADGLRADVLRLASGVRAAEARSAQPADAPGASPRRRRVVDFVDPARERVPRPGARPERRAAGVGREDPAAAAASGRSCSAGSPSSC